MHLDFCDLWAFAAGAAATMLIYFLWAQNLEDATTAGLVLGAVLSARWIAD